MSNEPNSFKQIKFETLEKPIQDLINQAVVTRNNSYSPYSNFKVGAAVLCEDGSVYNGCNVENAIFDAICAEKTSYVKAISEGKRKFNTVAVVADMIANKITAPCGICRQFMSEFGDVTIYMSTPALDQVCVTTLAYLLPFQFKIIPENGSQ